MYFQVSHVTTYRYSRPVRLGPHWLRLRPRCDGGTELLRHELDIEPMPAGRSDVLDADGNLATRVWFLGETEKFTVRSRFEARTRLIDPYDYLAEAMPWGALYAPALARRLAPWIGAAAAPRGVLELAAQVRAGAADGLEFVHRLNADLHRRIDREIRDSGRAHRPEETLRRGRGACRDLAVLFAAVCRSQGIASRFASGYQQGRADTSTRYMHAWPEVYLPGGGWRGFDPTHGLAVADRHVAVAAAADPEDAAPIEGSYQGDSPSSLRAEVRIHVED
ncbi:transglutaminase family protein [Parasulfuritortus cantonensis]|nr:transglutaminase family protein [Parasulfuritortus cantonensis]